MIDRVGQQFGNYRLIRLLGSGGFAHVYLGEQIYLKRQSAIKILQAQLAQKELQDFLAEARIIANLSHRNIVQVLEFGVEKDIPFLVMPYAPNGTLRQRHPSGSRVSLPEVVSYIRQVAAALQYAHDNRVIHRDVKPENMLVGQNSDILLSDFGIAVVAQSSRSLGQHVGGTVTYMAPEQLNGMVGPASDQYALAVVAYEWLAGEWPFKGGSFQEIAGQHMFTPPPPLRERVPSLPQAVEQVIRIALNKDPQQRFPDVQAFATALTQASMANDGPTKTSEDQISTRIKQPVPPVYPSGNNLLGNSGYYPSGNNPSALPPPPVYPTNGQNGNINTPQVYTSGMFPEAFPQPIPPGSHPETGKKARGNTGLKVAVIALVILLVAVTSAGAAYFFATRQTPTAAAGGQIQPTATAPQTGTSITPAVTPTVQSTATGDMTTATTVPATAATTAPWGPGTTNKKLICISNCDSNNGTFDITLTSIVVDTTHDTMLWNFSVQDNGNVCNDMYGSIKLVDPTGTYIDADGGTFIQGSAINSGQVLPKTATFSTLPKAGVLYEVRISEGFYAEGTYQTEHFQR